MNQVRVVIFIQVLNSFVSGVLTVALPLMMKERNVDVVVMGLVFASMPLIMQFGRMFFAIASDFWGRKLFFVSNGFFVAISSVIYYFAQAPLEFLFGKVVEGTKEGSLWAVNRPFLLEENGRHWKILVYLRTAAYVAFAVGSLLAGFFVIWLLYEGTMMFCALFGVFVIFLSLLLVSKRKERFSLGRALRFLDFRRKERIFKAFLALFLVMGLSFGLIGGFVTTLFLDVNGFDAEAIGLIIGVRILLAGLFSYLFSNTTRIRQLILFSGICYSVTVFLLSLSTSVLAGALMIVYGFVDGVFSIGHEGILSKISDKASYGTDIGLLMMGFHIGESISLALAGLLISMWGYGAPFWISGSIFVIFYVGSYLILKD